MKKNISNLTGACSGCGACSAICPISAISIKLDEEGFYKAYVNQERCVNCGICVDVCMKNGVNNAHSISDGKVYASQSYDTAVIKSCSSGGIAYEMSKYAIRQNYYVVGVIYDYTSNSAKTIVIENEEDIGLLQGSKYLQSYTEEAFSRILQIAKAESEKKILVFGTPCQIYGLATALEKLSYRERFVLVDLFCHGVPSMLVWKNYLNTIGAENKDIDFVAFRDKTIGWHNFVMEVQGQDFHYKKTSEGDLFYHAFFDNVLLAQSCFDCNVRKEKTKADIRLGDFWGTRYQEREDGISAVLINTLSGDKFYKEIKDIHTLEEVSLDEVIKSQSVYTYKNLELRNKAINELIETNNLKNTIKRYRKSFDKKIRLKLLLKEATSFLPDNIRAFLRKIYKKRS